MPLMPPGSQTNIYYIPVGNLPWNTTWKKLKDFAKNKSTLAIIHAYVYPGQTSTSGWVSVQGREDFRAAVYHMNHSAMEDPPRASRTLQADGRNEDNPVMLGESCPPTKSSFRPGEQQQRGQPGQSLYIQSSGSRKLLDDWSVQNTPLTCSTPMSPTFSGTSCYRQLSPHQKDMQSFSGFVPQREYMRCAQPEIFLSQMPPPISPMSPIFPMPQQVFVFPNRQQPESMVQMFIPHPPHIVAMAQAQPDTHLPLPPLRLSQKGAKREARKIIITGIPPTATQKDVQELIQSVSSTVTSALSPGPSPSRRPRHHKVPDGTRYYLQHLELAKHANGSPKGHAFAVLESYSTAKSTIDALNGIIWHSRKLRARFAKEGLESRNRGGGQNKQSEATQIPQNISLSTAISVRGREECNWREMFQEQQYGYTGHDNAPEVYHYPVAQFANIQIDYRGDDSSSSSSLASPSKQEENVSSVRSLSMTRFEKCDQKIVSEYARSPTPVVVNGSSHCEIYQ